MIQVAKPRDISWKGDVYIKERRLWDRAIDVSKIACVWKFWICNKCWQGCGTKCFSILYKTDEVSF
jgi:hypothetical protein